MISTLIGGACAMTGWANPAAARRARTHLIGHLLFGGWVWIPNSAGRCPSTRAEGPRPGRKSRDPGFFFQSLALALLPDEFEFRAFLFVDLVERGDGIYVGGVGGVPFDDDEAR